MITFTKAQQALLDRGWPRMIRLVEGHPRDKIAEKTALRWGATWANDVYHSEWPREAAARVVRLGPRIVPTGKRRNLHGGEPKAILSEHVSAFTGSTTSDHAREWVFLVEAFIGADETLDAIADGFESMRKEPRDVFALSFKAGVTSAVGFLLLRAKNPNKHVRRLDAVLAKLAAKKPFWSTTRGYLDASLHGRAGLDRWLGPTRRSVIAAEYAHDDAGYVRKCVSEGEPSVPLSVRLVAIAGPSVMKDITRRKFYADDLQAVIRDFGMIRAPETVELALSLVGRTTAKDAPVKWIAAHADYAMPFIEAMASKGNARAQTVAKLISGGRGAGERPSS